MYEEIRKPRLLKDVPLLLIRPLPAVYYFARFAKGQIPEYLSQMISGNISYLVDAQIRLGEKAGLPAFSEIASRFKNFCATPPEKRLHFVEKLTEELAGLCSEHRENIRSSMQELREEISKSYHKHVPTFSLLFVDYDREPGDNKIASMLRNFCFYNTQTIQRKDRSYAESLVRSDFIIFSSTQPARIHDDVLSLNDFRKPGLAIVEMPKDKPIETQTVRHAMQLIRQGFQVLFKVFTPIRLFTSVDREYIRFHTGQESILK